MCYLKCNRQEKNYMKGNRDREMIYFKIKLIKNEFN